jgi:diacylglycerol kinase (ATP)
VLMKRALLIVNESSGDNEPNREKVTQILKWLAPVGLELNVRFVSPEKPLQDDIENALDAGTRTILVGGGDGTVSPVAAKLVGTDAALGILPMGTYNNIARSIGLPTDLEEACGVIVEGAMRTIDAGVTMEGKYFFEAAGAGLDAQLFPLGEEIKGGRWMRLAQFAKLTMSYSARRMHLTFDCSVREAVTSASRHRYTQKTLRGRSVGLHALIVAVANGPYYGGGFTVAPTARLEDGKLTVVTFRRFSKIELLRHFYSISRGQRKYSPKTETFRAAEVRISSRQSLALHADGVPCGEAPATFRCVPQALRVYAPRVSP